MRKSQSKHSGKNLKSHLENAFGWFDENSLKPCLEKFQNMLLGRTIKDNLSHCTLKRLKLKDRLK